WARDADAYVLEDDYDSEFRYEGRPLPALAELDAHGRVILLGTFNKSLFPGLRLGYVVLPDGLIEPYRRLRRDVERPPPYVAQAVLADFMAGGHFARHVRRSREIYAARLAALRESIAGCSASDWLEIPTIPAGLCVPAYSIRGLSSQEIERRASRAKLDVYGLHRFSHARTGPRGALLGFAAFEEERLVRAARRLGRALSEG
ncbi:MAG: PLP-dependent aminotransferase family protein, partial [Proteobacteria bacterium]|nr:PLP-dependent aminotransferase family protein [Pseudomonadota bacterium]